MKTNVEKVLERDQKLSELDDRADALQQGASQFEQQAGKLKRKFWLQNLKVNSIGSKIYVFLFHGAELPDSPNGLISEFLMKLKVYYFRNHIFV